MIKMILFLSKMRKRVRMRAKNAPHTKNAGHAGHAKHDNLRTNYSIDDEFNPGDFFDDMDDERAFETLYS
jgi:hypothetical protein